MTDTTAQRLLAPDEPPAFSIEHADGTSAFFLVCDHAGRRIPRALGTLGLSESERLRHIAWDIGAAEFAVQLAALLDAFLIVQTYSRLVIDCNRPLDSPGSIVTRSERTDIPGNAGITPGQRQARADEIFAPYHARIVAELDRRAALARPTILVSVHSFTPVFTDVARPWHLGVLYQRDARFAQALLAVMREDGRWLVGDNEPYAVSDVTDFAIPVYGERRGLAHVELEVRQDLIAEPTGQSDWARRVARWLQHAAQANATRVVPGRSPPQSA